MRLGAFSVSLSVKDVSASKAFYEKLGFEVFGGDIEERWLIMKNDEVTIGLFQGMFEKNMLTFNPGWDSDAQPLEDFVDIRELQKRLLSSGLEIQGELDPDSDGPGSFILLDPDGNPILFDQHV